MTTPKQELPAIATDGDQILRVCDLTYVTAGETSYALVQGEEGDNKGAFEFMETSVLVEGFYFFSTLAQARAWIESEKES